MSQTLNLPLLSFIRSKAWAITVPGLQGLASHARSELSLSFADFFEFRPETTINANGTAMVHVHQALVDSCPPIYEKLGLVTSYGTIQQDVEAAIQKGAKRVAFVINSPGGSVAGLRELSEFIMDLPIPSMAYCSFACSAAYYLAASTLGIVASPSGLVGNIGTILSWADTDKAWEKFGIEWKAITNEGADLKSTFHLEPDAVQLAFLQEWINDSGGEFRNHVSSRRPGIDEEVFRAGWYSGERAIDLGLIEGMGSLNAAVLEFESEYK